MATSKSLRKEMLFLKNYDVIHFNHISLSFLALWCKLKNIGKSRVMHIRTMPPINFFSKLLCYASQKSCNDFVYITENEKHHIHSLIKQPKNNEVIIYNPIKFSSKSKKIYIKSQRKLKVGVLSNFSYNRGVDRTLEIFELIPSNKRHLFTFIFAGDMTLEKSVPKIPKYFTNNKKKFSDYVKTKNYKNNFIFLGQLEKPESLLKSIDVLLKPTRLNNPWGRDILEALYFGKPVISIGKYKKFVETNKTGLLQEKYDPNKIKDWLIALEANRQILNQYATEAKKRVKKLCDPSKASEKLIRVWTRIT